jgi:hypothetical protein
MRTTICKYASAEWENPEFSLNNKQYSLYKFYVYIFHSLINAATSL